MLQRHEKVLEVGAGSGHMAALLAHKAQQVITLEIKPALAKLAADNLKRADVFNATVREADGARGLPGDAPFDAIVLSGSVAEVPSVLLEQLKVGGRLVAIVGEEPVMRATLVTRVTERAYRSVDLFETVAPRLAGFAEPPKFKF
jgi:protein-L-isoaspartate(D-aspartate) O-methyltransferase